MKQKALCIIVAMILLTVTVFSAAGTMNPITSKAAPQTPNQSAATSDWQQIAKIQASDAANESIFGYSVGISGDYVVVGEGLNGLFGNAYIFHNDGTTWVQQAELNASDPALGKNFGDSVAINGDTAIIGAPGDNQWTGAAYVFTRTGATWTQQAKLTADDGVVADEFGFSVALSGDTAVIGASYAGNGWAGQAYVFSRSGTTWTQQAELLASDGAPEDQFGWSVAVSGNTAVVGSVYDDGRTGSAYVYTRTGTTWTEQQKLTASDAAPEDAFGGSVSIDGNTAVIGAGWKDTFMGAAYVYTRSGTTWTQQAKINASDGGNGDEFGTAVCLSGDKIVVGARFVNVWTGAAYIFSRTGTTWTQEQRINASDGAYFDQFAWSVGIDHNYVICGAPNHPKPNVGSAYIFEKPIPKVPKLNITVKGGFGFTAAIKNVGNANATDVNVTIALSGGLIFFGKTTQTGIPSIVVNQSIPFKTIIFGLGKTKITVSAVCDEGASAERTVNATLFLIFVLGVK
jgi:uncharacterized repeat protein (TIGR01451 family)